jgi:hypothetical protein
MTKTKETEAATDEDRMFRIIRQIELPPRTRIAGASKYPLHDLGINDAIETSTRNVKNVAVAARVFSKMNPGWKFITRRLAEHGKSALVRIA